MDYSNPFPYLAAAIFLQLFYVVTVLIKDARLKRENRLLKLWWVRLSICSMLVAMFGYLVMPEYSDRWFILHNAGELVAIQAFITYARRRYTSVPVRFSDRTDYLEIPKDKYGKITEGIWGRIWIPGTPMVEPGEFALIEQIKGSGYDLSMFTIVLIKAEEGGKFDWHKHPKREIMLTRKGRSEVHPDYPIAERGVSVVMPPATMHYFDCLEGPFAGAVLIED